MEIDHHSLVDVCYFAVTGPNIHKYNSGTLYISLFEYKYNNSVKSLQSYLFDLFHSRDIVVPSKGGGAWRIFQTTLQSL